MSLFRRVVRPLPIAIALLPLFTVPPAVGSDAAVSPKPHAHLVIHGGAGTLVRDEMSPELEAEYRAELAAALELGHRILAEGGSSLDAVEQTIRRLEDSPLFNAGRGAVFTAEGKNEMDASIMDGATRNAGAVSSVTNLRHPIAAARAVMEHSVHVMLSGPGAERFAASQGLETVGPEHFWTERRWESLQKRREREGEAPLPRPASAPEAAAADASTSETGGMTSRGDPGEPDHKFGTVGAVALDLEGRLAAGTSTGGMTYKRHGRVGDSPIIGAGTWADEGCGVSSTGHGEYFIRWAVAHEICSLMDHLDLSAAEAAHRVIHDQLKPAGGGGGVIVLSSTGDPALVFNTEGMYRGWIAEDGVPHVAIYGDEE